MGLFLVIIRILIDLFKMDSSKAYVSPLALLGREIGLFTKRKQTIHYKPVIHPEEPGLKGSILQAKILVRRRIPLPFYMKKDIEELELKIQQLQHDFKFLSFGRLDDFFYSDIHELKLCFERVSHHRTGVSLSKDQIIDGIKLRAQEEFPDDPNYVEIQSCKLDEIFRNQQENLTYDTNEILREIDRLEEINI